MKQIMILTYFPLYYLKILKYVYIGSAEKGFLKNKDSYLSDKKRS